MIVVTVEGKALQDDRQPTMKVLYELCGTDCIEVVPRVHAIVDEEATFKAKLMNKTASNWLGYPIYGDVVFLTDKEWKVFCA